VSTVPPQTHLKKEVRGFRQS